MTTSGRDALRAWFVTTLSEPKMSVHFVGNHVIDFDDADHARGIVYCHDELGRSNGGWDHGMLQYWDTYVRVDGTGGREWCFDRRKFLRWYMVDALERPSHGAGVGPGSDALTTSSSPRRSSRGAASGPRSAPIPSLSPQAPGGAAPRWSAAR